MSKLDPRRIDRTYYLITAVQTLAIMLPLAVLVLHMLDRGVSLTLVGGGIAVRGLIVVLLEVPSGALADTIGRKRTSLLSQSLTLASYLALLFLGAPGADVSLLLLFGLYVLAQGVGSAAHSGALDAWYVDTRKRADPATSIASALARVDVVIGLSSAVAVTIGAALPGLLGTAGLPYPLSGYGAAIAAGLLLRAVTFTLTAALISEPRNETVEAHSPSVIQTLRDAARLSRDPALRISFAIAFTAGFALIVTETLWQPAAQALLGFTASTSGVLVWLALGYGAALAIGPIVMMALVDRFGGSLSALAGLSTLVAALGIVWLGNAATPIGIGLALALAYMAIAAHGSPFEGIYNDRVPDTLRSVMLSVLSLCHFLGITVGGAAAGIFSDAFGLRATLTGGGALVVALCVLYPALHRAVQREVEVSTASAAD
jgi:MFS family permease